jgi:hypothetical protein
VTPYRYKVCSCGKLITVRGETLQEFIDRTIVHLPNYARAEWRIYYESGFYEGGGMSRFFEVSRPLTTLTVTTLTPSGRTT